VQTDDVGVFGSPVSNEYLLAAKHFDLSRKDVWNIALRAVDAMFAGDGEKERMKSRLVGFNGVLASH
jgi:adenosine deaminase